MSMPVDVPVIAEITASEACSDNSVAAVFLHVWVVIFFRDTPSNG